MTKKIKQDLAFAYQIVAHLGLDDHTYTHLSARAADGKSFYIQPFGLIFSEVTADNLLQVSFEGEVISGDEAQYNRTGYVIHGSIYQARPDIEVIFHLHTPAIISVSALKDGLLPINQWALHFYRQIAYHQYNSLALDQSHGQQLTLDLGQKMVMLLRHHGSVTCGRTIWQALFYTYHLELACKAQCMTLAMNREIIIPPEEICQQAVTDLLGFEKELGLRDWQAWLRLLAKKNS